MNLRRALANFVSVIVPPTLTRRRRIEKLAESDPYGDGAAPFTLLAQAVANANGDVFPIGVISTSKVHTIAILGDSISEQALSAGSVTSPATTPSEQSPNGYITWANMRLGGRLDFVYNGGIAGQHSDEILARVGNVIALNPKPGYCVVQSGTNDLPDSGTTNTMIVADIRATCDALLAAGITPIVCTIVPNNSVSSRQGAINRELKEYVAGTPGVLLCDWYPYLANPSTGAYATGMSGDGVHPNAAGASFMGKALADVLSPLVARYDPLIGSNAGTDNLLSNGMFAGTGGSHFGDSTGSVATDWTSWMGANATLSKVARTDGQKGEWQQIALTSPGTTDGTIYAPFSVTVGDVIVAQVEFEIDTAGLTDPIGLGIWLNNGSTTRANICGEFASGAYQIPPSGVIRSIPITMPSTETVNMFIRFHATAGTVRLGRASVCKVN